MGLFWGEERRAPQQQQQLSRYGSRSRGCVGAWARVRGCAAAAGMLIAILLHLLRGCERGGFAPNLRFPKMRIILLVIP